MLRFFRLFASDGDGGGGGGAPPPPAAAPPAAAPAAAAPSWETQVFDSTKPGHFVQDWVTKAPDPAKLQPYATAKTFAELVDTAEKRVTEAQTALRNKAASGLPARPEKDAPPEYWKAYYQAHGLPEKAADYGFKKPDGIADEMWDASGVGQFADLAHQIELKPEQAKSILEFYHKNLQDGISGTQKAEAEGWAAFKHQEAVTLATTYGDKLDSTLNEAQSIADAFGLKELSLDPLNDKFVGVPMTKFIVSLIERIPRGEGQTMANMGAPSQSGQYDKAWAQAAVVKGHPDYEAMTNPRHPRHAEITALRNQAYALGR